MAEKASIRVAAVQIAPDLETLGATLTKVLGSIAEAAERGARLAVFPETFVPWYPYFSFVYPPALTGAEHIRLYDNAVVVPGPVTEAVAGVAKRHGIVVVLGINERDHGPLFADQIEVTIRHHALESGCFVVNATGWLTEEQIAKISPDEKLRKALRGGCMTAIISPEGSHVVPPLTQGEGILAADLDMGLIVKRKRMMDSVGHYARPELLKLVLDNRPARPMEVESMPTFSTVQEL